MTIKTILRYICNHLCRDEPSSPFTMLRHRSWRHLLLVLQKQFPNAVIRIADKDYSTPTKQEFEAWLKSNPANEHQYHAEYYDCDDFAEALRCAMFKVGHKLKTTIALAYCEGPVSGVSGRHAFNLLIDEADKLWIMEPQNDSVVPATESAYIPDFVQL